MCDRNMEVILFPTPQYEPFCIVLLPEICFHGLNFLKISCIIPKNSLIFCVEHHQHQCFLPKGRSFTANSLSVFCPMALSPNTAQMFLAASGAFAPLLNFKEKNMSEMLQFIHLALHFLASTAS